MHRAGAPHVVVIGAGFGGLTAARELAEAARDRPLRVTLVDRRNHHTFQPLLYQVATAGLQPQDVGHALRPIFGRRPRSGRSTAVDVRLGDVVDVDREAKQVVLDDGARLGYDRLVVAAGAITNDLGLPGVAEHAFTLKSLPDALALRDHVLRLFEQAATDPPTRSSSADDGELTFVVVGAGPTGVELSGAIAELVDGALARDHPHLDLRRVRIVLVEMADRVLPPYHPRSSRYAKRALERRGVEVRLETAVTRAEADRVVLDDGSEVPTRTLVWVAGVAPAPIGTALGAPTGPGGRIEVTETLQLADDPDVYAIGDVAAARDADGEVLPQLAPVAIQQGRYTARRLVAALDGEETVTPFRYVDKGTMATIGRHDAVAELPFGIRFGGVPAWLAWLGLHLMFLVGFRNRVAVFFSWLWNYLTYDRAARLILHGDEEDAVDRARPVDRAS